MSESAVRQTRADLPAIPGSPARKAAAIGLTGLDVVLAITAGVMVIFVHDVHYMLNEPYWLDEAWVADSIRAPLSEVPRLASSTPLGWTMLLRLVPGGGLERQRLVPLAFAGLAVATGYLLGRELRLTRFVAGLLTAAAVLLSPAMLVRDDLKQYTAEAFAALLIWLLVARLDNTRLDNTRSRWWLAALALVTSVGTLFAETAIFTGGAAFTCLFLVALGRRQWRRLAELAVAGAGTLAIFAVIFVAVLKPRIDPQLSSYWAPLYSPTSVTGAARFFWTELSQRVGPEIGFPAGVSKSPTTPATVAELAIPLALTVAGIAALAVMRRYALAALLPVTLVVAMTASAARQYPFGDERTSTYWEVMFPVLMAIAVAAAIGWLGLAFDRLSSGVRRWALPVVAVAIAAAAIAGYVQQVRPDINSHTIPDDDSRSQVQFAEAHYRAGDVFLVDFGASYGFDYYYGTPTNYFPAVAGNAAGFIPQYLDPHVVVMTTRNEPDFAVAMRKAINVLDAEPASEHGRVWVIREHLFPTETDAWAKIFTQLGNGGGHVTVYRLNQYGYKPGFMPLALYTPPPHRASQK
jgi:hypothetical protein